MHTWLRAGYTALVLAILISAAAFGSLAPFDNALQDLQFRNTSFGVTGRVATVEIDSKSISEIGVWPWSRQLHGEVLDSLMAMGANQVAFDVDFNSQSAEDGDAAFAKSLHNAGGFAFLAAFVQATPTGTALSLPLASFLAEAEPVLVNVLLDGRGQAISFLRSIGTNGGTLTALPSALSGLTVPGEAEPGIDFGIDIGGVTRLSFVDVLRHRIDPTLVAGKDIIVGASAIELRDFFQTPRYGILAGPLLQLLATETLLQNRSLQRIGLLPSLLVTLFAAGLLLLWGRKFSLRMRAAAIAVALLAWPAIAFLFYLHNAILLDTALFLVAMPLLFTLELIEELRLQIAQRRQAQQRLAYLAQHDLVTGKLSRVGLFEELAQQPQRGSVVLVKLVRMDNVRATLGQDVGNAVLRLTAQRLAELRPVQLGHIREDTFALWFAQQMDAEALGQICGQIEKTVDGMHRVSGHVIRIDIALATATGAQSGERLVQQAEIALLPDGKARSRNNFDPEQANAIEYRRRLDIDLRTAIASNSLHLVFQPQIALASGKLIGAEALVRWEHPELGEISPAVFVPLAEETGAIVDLGRWVLGEACRHQARWRWNGRLAVNVSPIQFELSDLAEDVRLALGQAGLAANRLDIEITEGALVDNVARAKAVMLALHQSGVGLALDDFGTGYSALSYLATLSFDKIKIDQSFVREMDASPAGNALLQTIVDLCARLGKVSVAEGIETFAQASQLKAWGCTIGQGYLYSKPLAASEFEALMQRPVSRA